MHTCFVQVPLQLHRLLHLHVVLEDAAAELSRLPVSEAPPARAQPEAPPAAARTHDDCLGRCGPLSAARTGSRAAAAAPNPLTQCRINLNVILDISTDNSNQ